MKRITRSLKGQILKNTACNKCPYAVTLEKSFRNDKIADLCVIYETIMVHVRGLESLVVSAEK